MFSCPCLSYSLRLSEDILQHKSDHPSLRMKRNGSPDDVERARKHGTASHAANSNVRLKAVFALDVLTTVSLERQA